jgi:hypothetical protein
VQHAKLHAVQTAQELIGPTAGVLEQKAVNVGKVKGMKVNDINCITSKA